MSELPQATPPYDPELEKVIRRNVGIYWDADAPYERRVVARHALQALAVEGFQELLLIVDMLRSELSRQDTYRMRQQHLLPLWTPVKPADISPDSIYEILSGLVPIGTPKDDK